MFASLTEGPDSVVATELKINVRIVWQVEILFCCSVAMSDR